MLWRQSWRVWKKSEADALDAVLNLLGLARRAGRLAVGEETVAATVRAGDARLLILTEDASEHLVRRAAHFGKPVLRLTCSKLQLGPALGKSTCAIAAVTDPGLAASVAEKLGTPEAAAIAQRLQEDAKRIQARRREQQVHDRRRKSQGGAGAPVRSRRKKQEQS